MTTSPQAQPALPVVSELSPGDIISETTVELRRADLVRYAGISGDANPIHWSEETARASGLPGVIAHGMLSMGTAVDLVSHWCTDPGRILDYQSRFTSMVPVAETTPEADPTQPFTTGPAGARLAITAKVGAVTADTGVVRIDLVVTNPDDGDSKVLTKAQVLVQLDPVA
ncbi:MULTISPECIES: MaoC/PaaZ C-terminal domain-containing protein [Auritidibacter]|uniref:MaoC/PaaZ C-terminal domain-containing protein n=1 Tax=Auritidibacter ignavus TaxID=678932 RepID=A0AAJ6DC45_9MICC|nr:MULTISPECIES: MaoC/PaaZ C-terminal domain-containing protein [Auritidibacter]PXA77548.1 acyl dehydratase [Auritidibacter sp. NML120779]AXR72977.1 acyl dehydratase [Auritidibacter sp. NML130574]NIH71389.1 hypothetical protein [Auritidibacter ignavus]PXA80974.1 acyl dehydratase [Auritidibacter sp. NML120636]RMX22465.1 acyl dehydratase [Auritidibacter ignavus]